MGKVIADSAKESVMRDLKDSDYAAVSGGVSSEGIRDVVKSVGKAADKVNNLYNTVTDVVENGVSSEGIRNIVKSVGDSADVLNDVYNATTGLL